MPCGGQVRYPKYNATLTYEPVDCVAVKSASEYPLPSTACSEPYLAQSGIPSKYTLSPCLDRACVVPRTCGRAAVWQ